MEEDKRLQAIDGGRCEKNVHPSASGEPPQGTLQDAISVAYIKQRLLELPKETGWEVFKSLDLLLKPNSVWRKHDVDIYEALTKKEQEEERRQREFMHIVEVLALRPTNETKIGIFNNQGGTYNDNSGATFQPYSLQNQNIKQ